MTGVFGNGWTWNYGVNLDVTTDTYGALLTSADGAKHYFKRNADNTFTGEYGLFSQLSYDSTAQEYTLLHPNQDREIFDSAGRLARQVDPDGNTTTLTRDGSGILTTVTEPTGRMLTFTYASGRIATITDPLGRVYRYTNNGTLTKLEKELPATTVFATCTYTYGANSVLTKRVGCDGDTLEQTFNATTKKVETQTLNGVQVRLAYGPVTDSLTGVTFPQYTTGVWDTFGKLHLYYYTKSNAVFEHDRENFQDAYGTYYFYQEDRWEYATFVSSSYTDILSRRTSTERNWRRGTVLASTDESLNRQTEFTYDAFNNLLTTTDPLDRVQTNTYDAEHHLVSTENALGNVTTTTYTPAGLVATVTDALDAESSFTYDSYGYPETVTTATNETVTFDYDIAGRKLWEETPDGERTTYTYDGRDNVLTVTDPLGNVTTTVYDTKGRKVTVEDADGYETTFAYNDTKNALVTTTDALGGVVTYTYNPNNTLQKVTDALGHITSFTYDAFGRQASVTDPLTRLNQTVYRADGSTWYTIDGRGNRTDYSYNAGGELTTVTYQDDATVTFLYDGVGNRTRMIDTDGQLDITYDDLNRPLTRTRTSPAGTETVTYAYDEVGNLETLGYPGGFSVTYAYDDARRVTTVTDSQNRVTEYDYNTNGRILTVALPNGTNATYAYDDAGRITSVTHSLGQTPFATVGHTYDDRGNRLTRTVDGTTESYTYDALARITEAAYPGNRTVGYVYDATGNRTQKTDPLGATAYTYDTADQLLNAGDGLRTYDLDGQLARIGASRSFTWNDRGQLTGVSAVTTNAAPTARAGADASGNVDWLMFLDGSTSTDPEGIALSYTWTEVAGNPSTGVLRGIHASRPALLAGVAGTYQFDLVVSDGAQTSTPDRVQVAIATGLPPATVQTVVPASGLSGYVVSNLPNGRYFTSDTLITGRSSTVTFHGAAQFALPTPPPQTTLTGATLTLWGKQVASNTVTDQWSVQLLPTDMDPTFAQATYTTITGATPDRTLTPVLVGLGQVVANQADAWTFTEDDLAVLQARLDGSGKLSLRTRGDSLGTYSRVFWYSGNTTVANRKPTLSLSYTPDPLPDQAPFAHAGRSQTLDAPGTVTLDGRASFDAEGPVTLLWTAHAANPASVTFTDATIAEPSVTLTVPGTYRFDLAVTDGADVTTTASTFVVVRSAPLPTTSSFTYDGDGDRIAMTVGSVTTRFVVDPLPQNARVLAERTGETWTYHVYGHDLLYSVTGAAFTVLHSDPLGSTIATTDATGAVTARLRYDVFGERLDSDASTTAYTFAGERMDLTELQYLRARYYDPTVGRFISRDPFPAQAADTQTFNRYVYVKNNPTNYVDPSGEWLETGWDIINAVYDLYDVGKRLWYGEPVGEALLNLGMDSASVVLPFVPAGVTRAVNSADDVVDAARGAGKAIDNADDFKRTYNLEDGMEMSTDDALRKAEEVLGPGYTEVGTPGSGVFRSTGSPNQVRMKSSDLSPTNNHAGRPHINFELLPTSGKGPMRCIIHLFLSDC
ncbi:MAG: RHS repeat-associated core domain-containing protein [Holophagales bacterium]|nr:RHS repeat-associated core domain-containing protein [Holophagales bacterium]